MNDPRTSGITHRSCVLLLRDAEAATAQRLTRRARDMLDLAEQAQDPSATLTSALDLFNSRQMFDQDKAEA